jgi:hypothetical protein
MRFSPWQSTPRERTPPGAESVSTRTHTSLTLHARIAYFTPSSSSSYARVNGSTLRDKRRLLLLFSSFILLVFCVSDREWRSSATTVGASPAPRDHVQYLHGVATEPIRTRRGAQVKTHVQDVQDDVPAGQGRFPHDEGNRRAEGETKKTKPIQKPKEFSPPLSRIYLPRIPRIYLPANSFTPSSHPECPILTRAHPDLLPPLTQTGWRIPHGQSSRRQEPRRRRAGTARSQRWGAARCVFYFPHLPLV